MRIGILGTGDVGQALGRGFIKLGYETCMGSREKGNPKAKEWANGCGAKALTGTFSDAAKFGDIVVLATLGLATPEAIKMANPNHFAGKVVLDTTNPLDLSKGMPPRLAGGLGESGGEIHQKLLPKAQVVKVFNTVGNALMFKPKLSSPTVPDMFICGNDTTAKVKVTDICKDFGWNTVDIGGIETSHYLEAMCMVWVLSAIKTNSWMQAFKLLK